MLHNTPEQNVIRSYFLAKFGPTHNTTLAMWVDPLEYTETSCGTQVLYFWFISCQTDPTSTHKMQILVHKETFKPQQIPLNILLYEMLI